MKKEKIHLLLKSIYLIILLLILVTIVIIPKLVQVSTHFTETVIIKEEFIEGFFIVILLGLSFLIQKYYNKELEWHRKQVNIFNNDKKLAEEKLDDAFRYIGKVNVQIQEIKSVFSKNLKYPETKNEFKKILNYFSKRTLGIVNTDWVLIRIIDSENQKTISEHLGTREDFTLQNYPNISNRTIINGRSYSSLAVIASHPQNINIVSCCVFPTNNISNEQQNLIKAIVSQITMLFIIFESKFYNKSDKKNLKK